MSSSAAPESAASPRRIISPCGSGVGRVVIVDEREPLTLTSDKGTQAIATGGPVPTRRCTASSRGASISSRSPPPRAATRFGSTAAAICSRRRARRRSRDHRDVANQVSSFGMGAVRTHDTIATYQPAPAEGFADQPDGADLLLGDAVHAAFPYLAARHHRRAPRATRRLVERRPHSARGCSSEPLPTARRSCAIASVASTRTAGACERCNSRRAT